MKHNFFKFFVLFILLSSPAFSQMVPKWKFLAPLQSVSIYDINHYMGQPTGESYNHPIFFIYNKFGDTNYYKFEVKWNTGDSTVPEVRGFTYGDSLTIFAFIDSAKYVGLQGVNIIYKYIGVIFKSTDGGKTWKKIQLNPNFRSRKSVGLNMRDKMNGIVVQFPDSSEQFSKIWITNDGWETFREITNHNILAPKNFFYNPPKILIFDVYCNLYYSFDNGQTFTKDSTFQNYFLPLANLRIVNDKIMIISGTPKDSNMKDRKIYFRTTDGGINWDYWEPVDINKIYEVYGDSSSVSLARILNDSVYILGVDARKKGKGISLLTTDNGKSWIELSNIWYNNEEWPATYDYFEGNYVFATGSFWLFYHTIGDSTLMPPTFYGPYYKIPKNFTLRWQPIEGATKYQIQVVELEGFDFVNYPQPIGVNYDSVLFDDVIVTGTSYSPPNTKNWKIYCCRIRSMNDSLVSEWNSKWYLTEPEPNDVESQIGCESTKIYPNPARENITFEQLPENVRKIKILDMLGNEVLSLPIQKSIDIEKLPAGVYYLRFEPSFEVFKFIKY